MGRGAKYYVTEDVEVNCHPRPSDSEGKGTHDRAQHPVVGPLPSPRHARFAGDDNLCPRVTPASRNRLDFLSRG